MKRGFLTSFFKVILLPKISKRSKYNKLKLNILHRDHPPAWVNLAPPAEDSNNIYIKPTLINSEQATINQWQHDNLIKDQINLSNTQSQSPKRKSDGSKSIVYKKITP